MSCTVVWKPSAEDELAALWLAADDRGAITAAMNGLERLLGRDPESVGESRSGSARIAFIPPLVATFDVLPDDRVVRVLSVRSAQR